MVIQMKLQKGGMYPIFLELFYWMKRSPYQVLQFHIEWTRWLVLQQQFLQDRMLASRVQGYHRLGPLYGSIHIK